MIVENIEREHPQPHPETMIDNHVFPFAEWNDTHREYPRNCCIHQLFEEQARHTPDAIAVEFAGRSMTYADLDARANRLAHHLRAHAVGPETRVGLCAQRSLEMMVGVLGILKADAAYVPIDPTYPAKRVEMMCRHADITLVLTYGDISRALIDASVVRLNLEEAHADLSADSPICTLTPLNAAYVIYTSGSTGHPKGIVMPHEALVNLLYWHREALPLPARTLQFTSIGFDVSFQEIFSTWCSGSTLVLISEEDRRDPIALLRVLAEEKIERLFVPFAVLQHLALAHEEGSLLPRSVREVITAGEQLQITGAIKALFSGDTATLHNHYGPTETHVVTAFTLEGSVEDWPALPPIGRPIANTQIRLLDSNWKPTAVGVPAELCIGGACLAREYLAHPGLTAEKFVSDPFSSQPGARLYRTGDLARYLPDGNIEFLGRIDHQVKIRGFRIELGEIETVLLQHPQVREAVVLAREDMPGDKRLAAYVVSSDTMRSVTALREYLHERLPDYMVPAVFVYLEAFPLSPNGKIDRRALPAPDWSSIVASGTFVAPQSPLEEPLTEIWQKVLGMRSVSVDANFFDLGGHSLLAIRLLSEIKSVLGMGLSLAEMLNAPTVSKMARLLQRKGAGEDTWSPLVPLQSNGERPPLFCAPVGGGSAFYYRMLAEHIGPDQPVYVFEPIAMNGIDLPHDTVEEMAAFYIQHMRTVQTRGPYHLCGLSFGGVVAFEMAHQLTAAGERVGCLIFFDTQAPGYASRNDPSSVTGLRLSLQNTCYTMEAYLENLRALPTVGRRVRYLSSRLRTMIERLRRWTPGTPWKPAYMNPVDTELPDVFQSVLQAEEHSRSLYRPPSYAGRIVLLRTHLQEPETKDAPKLGWDDLAPNIEVIATPGTHYSILEEPCVHPTLRHVTRILEASHAGDERNCAGTSSP
ncbi:MAG: amino acid adenylation domain protein [Chthonomonadaceae bacterium]|nr:amino acid adenylation domain protein [Chthonomonadaceae bacterium]